MILTSLFPRNSGKLFDVKERLRSARAISNVFTERDKKKMTQYDRYNYLKLSNLFSWERRAPAFVFFIENYSQLIGAFSFLTGFIRLFNIPNFLESPSG